MTDTIRLAHGGGGTLMQALIAEEIAPTVGEGALDIAADSARLDNPDAPLAFTTDSFVVQPLLFPGGDIGRLAVCGTVNDLAARGAEPIALSLSLILEEGLPMETLRTVLRSAAQTATEAGTQIVTGDTKVVERGGATGVYINTAGIGRLSTDMDFTADRIEPGDALIVNGPLGDHGIAVMSVREGIAFESAVRSDVAPLNTMVHQVLDACGDGVRCMKDPTRGGVAATVNEMARGVGFELDEATLPVRNAVRGACDLLGFDVLTIANEGKMLFVVSPDREGAALDALHNHPLGKDAAIIGRADDRIGSVRIATSIGGRRIVETPYGEELPRIC